MADVSNDLMYELLKRIDAGLSTVNLDVSAVKSELDCLRGPMAATQADIHNIDGVPGRRDDRLDRIVRRLDRRGFAEPPSPYRSI